MMLGEQGADVIKVEPLGGDILRVAGGSLHKGTSAMFVNANRAKRSIAINLKDERGISLLAELINGADVLVENFREGAMRRLGLGYEALRAVHPRLIYARINGFGKQGSRAGQRVYDPLIQALSGALTLRTYTDVPEILPMIIADKVTPIMLSQAITAALYERERSGLGQHIEVSMLHALLWWMWPENMTGHTFIDAPEVTAYTYDNVNPLHRTSDGRYICILAPSDAEWAAVAEAFERPDWLTDEQFCSVAARVKNSAGYQAAISAEVAKRTFSTCINSLAKCDACFAPVNTRDDVIRDPQITANEMFADKEHAELGRIRQPSPCVEFSRTGIGAPRLAPTLNQDAAEILGEIGYGGQEIESLVMQGVVGKI
jgi:crotonobetainyl-CoA:carnitine CoA-transferase CaiB-like acyl-CoA transferase